MKTTILNLAIFLAIIVLVVSFSSIEHGMKDENIIPSMRDNVFESVCLTVGDNATDEDITAEYTNNKEYYDSLEEDEMSPRVR